MQNPETAEQLKVEGVLRRQEENEGKRADLNHERSDLGNRHFTGVADIGIDVRFPYVTGE